ncbi:MAG: DUF5667 domain-containing protein [bacterium]|nr:DUF5667 domain-containing protein [bacterium]
MKKMHRNDPISQLRDTARLIEPDERWILDTRKTLLREMKNALPEHQKIDLKGKVQATLTERFQILRGPVFAVFGVIFILFSGSIASVSASERSLPGDFLYSLKLVTEQARLAFTKPKDEKLKLKVEFATRRGDELKRVIEEPDESGQKEKRVEQAAEILKRDLDTVKKQLEDVKNESEPSKVVEAAKLVDEKSSELFDTLEQAKSSVLEGNQVKVREAQSAIVTTGGKAIETLIDAHDVDGAAISEEDVVDAMNEYTKTVKSFTGVEVTEAVATTTTSLSGSESSTSTTTGLILSDPEELKETYAKVKIATEQAIAKSALESASGTLAIPGDSVDSESASSTNLGTTVTTTESILENKTSGSGG